MVDQLASSPEQNIDSASAKPQEAPANARAILGDNLPANQTRQAQPVKKTTPIVLSTETAKTYPVAPKALADTDVIPIERLVLRALFGGSSFSFQAAMLKGRRARAKRSFRQRQTPEEIMLNHARSVIGNPDQNTVTPKKAA